MTWTISDVISATFRSFGRNWVTLVVGNLVAMLIAFAPLIVSAAITMPMLFAHAGKPGGPGELVVGTTIVVMLLAFVAAFVLLIMFAPALSRIALAAARDERPLIRDVFDFQRAGTFLRAGFLSSLAIAGAMLLLIVPGIIVALALLFVSFYVVDKPGLGATDALAASWNVTRGHRLRLLGLVLVGGIAHVLLHALFATSVVFAPLQLALSLVVGPITTLALAQVFVRLEPRPSIEGAQTLAA